MVKYGFQIGYVGELKQVHTKNWPSAEKEKEKVTEYIGIHLTSGAIELIPENETEFRLSPLGAFPKKNSQKIRVIHDLSWPPGESVNDGIDKEDFSVRYTSISDAVKLCSKYDTPYLAKCDLMDAYLSCPIAECDRNKLGFEWEIDGSSKKLRFAAYPFGLRSSPFAFSKLGTALLYIAKSNGTLNSTISYLDDTLFVAPDAESCSKSLHAFLDCVKSCGFKIQDNKTCGPARNLEFLGIIINTEEKTLKISQERMDDIRSEIDKWFNKRICTKRELLSVIGKLQFAAKVVNNGHMFLRRLIHKSKSAKNLHYKIYIDDETLKDLRWWKKCIGSHNGVAWFNRCINPDNSVLVFTDASNEAAAGVIGNKWTLLQFVGKNAWMKEKTIAWRELLAVVLTIATFGGILRYCDVIMNIDNQAIQTCIENGKSKDPEIMALIRCLYFYCAIYNINYRAIHLSSKCNQIADSVSRLNFALFRTLVPNAEVYMTNPVDIILNF